MFPAVMPLTVWLLCLFIGQRVCVSVTSSTEPTSQSIEKLKNGVTDHQGSLSITTSHDTRNSTDDKSAVAIWPLPKIIGNEAPSKPLVKRSLGFGIQPHFGHHHHDSRVTRSVVDINPKQSPSASEGKPDDKLSSKHLTKRSFGFNMGPPLGHHGHSRVTRAAEEAHFARVLERGYNQKNERRDDDLIVNDNPNVGKVPYRNSNDMKLTRNRNIDNCQYRKVVIDKIRDHDDIDKIKKQFELYDNPNAPEEIGKPDSQLPLVTITRGSQKLNKTQTFKPGRYERKQFNKQFQNNDESLNDMGTQTDDFKEPYNQNQFKNGVPEESDNISYSKENNNYRNYRVNARPTIISDRIPEKSTNKDKCFPDETHINDNDNENVRPSRNIDNENNIGYTTDDMSNSFSNNEVQNKLVNLKASENLNSINNKNENSEENQNINQEVKTEDKNVPETEDKPRSVSNEELMEKLSNLLESQTKSQSKHNTNIHIKIKTNSETDPKVSDESNSPHEIKIVIKLPTKGDSRKRNHRKRKSKRRKHKKHNKFDEGNPDLESIFGDVDLIVEDENMMKKVKRDVSGNESPVLYSNKSLKDKINAEILKSNKMFLSDKEFEEIKKNLLDYIAKNSLKKVNNSKVADDGDDDYDDEDYYYDYDEGDEDDVGEDYEYSEYDDTNEKVDKAPVNGKPSNDKGDNVTEQGRLSIDNKDKVDEQAAPSNNVIVKHEAIENTGNTDSVTEKIVPDDKYLSNLEKLIRFTIAEAIRSEMQGIFNIYLRKTPNGSGNDQELNFVVAYEPENTNSDDHTKVDNDNINEETGSSGNITDDKKVNEVSGDILSLNIVTNPNTDGSKSEPSNQGPNANESSNSNESSEMDNVEADSRQQKTKDMVSNDGNINSSQNLNEAASNVYIQKINPKNINNKKIEANEDVSEDTENNQNYDYDDFCYKNGRLSDNMKDFGGGDDDDDDNDNDQNSDSTNNDYIQRINVNNANNKKDGSENENEKVAFNGSDNDGSGDKNITDKKTKVFKKINKSAASNARTRVVPMSSFGINTESENELNCEYSDDDFYFEPDYINSQNLGNRNHGEMQIRQLSPSIDAASRTPDFLDFDDSSKYDKVIVNKEITYIPKQREYGMYEKFKYENTYHANIGPSERRLRRGSYDDANEEEDSA